MKIEIKTDLDRRPCIVHLISSTGHTVVTGTLKSAKQGLLGKTVSGPPIRCDVQITGDRPVGYEESTIAELIRRCMLVYRDFIRRENLELEERLFPRLSEVDWREWINKQADY